MRVKFNVDRIRICLKQPENFYESLYNDLKIFPRKYYDGFYLSRDDSNDVNDKDITASLFIDSNPSIELGKFTFNKSNKFGTKCFFSYATKCLYEAANTVYEGKQKGWVKYNYFSYPFYAFNELGLVFNNVTHLEVAADTDSNIINKIRYAISHPELFYLILLGKNVDDPEQILDGFYEFFQRSRVKKANHPTLYVHPIRIDSYTSGNRSELKIYDKARELAQLRKDKEVLTRVWNDMPGNIQRMEIAVENKKFKQFYRKVSNLNPNRWESIEHFFYDLGMNEALRCEMFDFFAANLLHFKIHNRYKQQVSLLDLTVNTMSAIKKMCATKRKP